MDRSPPIRIELSGCPRRCLLPTITIEGNGFTIDGDNKYQPFRILEPVTLTLNNMTLTKGRAISRWGDSSGGAIRMIGEWDFLTGPTVTLNNVR